jgi:hypothetical protein
MRALFVLVVILFLIPPAFAADRVECSQIPHAQSFLNGLKPGPNTRAAQGHLNAAKKARSDKQCVAELKKVDFYARRSAAADKKSASAAPPRTRQVQCADAMHQDRPGGSDYRGPPTRSCKRVL